MALSLWMPKVKDMTARICDQNALIIDSDNEFVCENALRNRQFVAETEKQMMNN
jgi:hypothetical protein